MGHHVRLVQRRGVQHRTRSGQDVPGKIDILDPTHPIRPRSRTHVDADYRLTVRAQGPHQRFPKMPRTPGDDGGHAAMPSAAFGVSPSIVTRCIRRCAGK